MFLMAGARAEIDLASAAVHPLADCALPIWPHLLKVAAVLCGLLGLVLLLHWWRHKEGWRRRGRAPLIQVVETRPVGPRRALILVEVEQQRFLLAQTGECLSLLALLTPADRVQSGRPEPLSANARLSLPPGSPEGV
jgi:flagellar biogenesis protein FliO